MPSARLFLLLAFASLLSVGSLADGRLGIATLVLDGLLVLAFGVDLWRARGTVVRAERRWPPLLSQGGSATVELAVELPSQAGARTVRLRLREGLHPALAEAPKRHEMILSADGQASAASSPGNGIWRYELVPRHRGAPKILPLTARILGPWGLAWWQRDLLPPERRRVYPQVRWQGQVGHLLALAQRHQLGTMPSTWQGTGTEPYALREYVAGDPPNKIHWKASARHGRLVTREETWELGARLVILLDCARTMTGRDGQRSKLDHALAASLALARVAMARGDHVTVIGFSDRIERVVRSSGAGGRGASRASRIYASLFDLEARLGEPAYDLAVEKALELERRSATVFLFTSVVDLAAAELLRESLLRLERRHRPLLVNLLDPDLVRLASAAPETADEAFAQVSALEIELANAALGRQLRKAGVRVVTTPADRLALETLETYLSLFRGASRGRRAG